ncbi:hypothetical protein VL15_07200 [Burkholderia cepacia]|uniref:Uncharacterized protein n=1 Tax=Burkholderia cepacia TaxID=292 RepID=A0A0J5X8K7_BURCE|nr:hypothetical protein [Burkholderia cepacia]KML60891.1 hypothetical protein VL15_07200 [Burkholderia cepacia]
MKDTINNLALGLGVAALGFALLKYFQGARGGTSGAAGLGAPIGASTSPNAGSIWQNLTFPLGTNTGGVNVAGNVDQVYSSTSWNPDDISAQLGADAIAAMGAAGQSTANVWGFHV